MRGRTDGRTDGRLTIDECRETRIIIRHRNDVINQLISCSSFSFPSFVVVVVVDDVDDIGDGGGGGEEFL